MSAGITGSCLWPGLEGVSPLSFFGLWRVCFPPCLVRPGRRLPVQGLSEGSLGYPVSFGLWSV